MTPEQEFVEQIKEDKKKPIRNKWIPYTFGPEPIPLEPYEVDPVSDIPIRLAVERGVIPRKRALALYRTTEDWNGHPKRSIVIAGPIEEGQPFAVWIGDGSYTPPKSSGEAGKPKKHESLQQLLAGFRHEERADAERIKIRRKAAPSIQRAAPPRFKLLTSSAKKIEAKPATQRACRILIPLRQPGGRKSRRRAHGRIPQTFLALQKSRTVKK
ncbi:MAG: hypothetical protein JXR73_00660 [Candidatus Omnitrophica bacterium]|nr:hypothetical protein [Candidatus Omnitrophota bacterium]